MSDTERKYYLTDYETGHQTPVPKEVWEAYNAWMSKQWADAMPRMGDAYKGVPMVFGITGELDDCHNDLQELFTSPGNYQLVDEKVYDLDKITSYFVPVYDQSYDKFGQPNTENNGIHRQAEGGIDQ